MNKIKAVALDVDGVLTDGTFIWGTNGKEYKKFSFTDVMGISLGIKAGLIFALISGESSHLVDRFADKMGITDVHKGCKDKALVLHSFVQKHNITLSEVCFMGDDVNDLPALKIAGFSTAPPTAHRSVLEAVDFVAHHPGGKGAVRDVLDYLMSHKEL